MKKIFSFVIAAFLLFTSIFANAVSVNAEEDTSAAAAAELVEILHSQGIESSASAQSSQQFKQLVFINNTQETIIFSQDFTVPQGVKLQIPATVTSVTVNSTITVNGVMQDGKTITDRNALGGTVGSEGTGKILINKGGIFFYNGAPIISGRVQLTSDDASISISADSTLNIETGTVTLGGNIAANEFKNVVVKNDAILNKGSYTIPNKDDSSDVTPPVDDTPTAAENADAVVAFLRDSTNCDIGTDDSTDNIKRSGTQGAYEVVFIGTKKFELKKDLVIPSNVKIQIGAQCTDYAINGKFTINGNIQDSRPAANRTEGIVGKGSGSVIFTDSAKYYQQGIAFIDTTTGIMKLNSDSSVTFKPSNVLEITSGTVSLIKSLKKDTHTVSTVNVLDGATFIDGGLLENSIILEKPNTSKQDLKNEIMFAEKNINSALESIDGTEIDSNKFWSTSVAKDTYNKAIDVAKAVLNNESSSTQQSLDAISELKIASLRFNSSKQTGKNYVAEISTYEELVNALNALEAGCAKYNGAEDYNQFHYEVVEITKPVTIDTVITVPSMVKLQLSADVTINGRLNIKGTLQDKYKNIYGLTGKDGVGDVAFTPGSYMYIAGLGEVIGDTGGVKIDESSMMTISIQNKLSVINGTVEIPKSVNTALTNGIYGFNSSKLLVTGSIPTTITVNMFDDSQYIDNSIQNSEIKLGLVGSSVNTNDNASLNAEIRDDLIYLTVLSKEKKEVEVQISDATDVAKIIVNIEHGAIVSKEIYKVGGKTQAELSDEIEKKINTLNELITKAKDKNLDAKREEGVIWFANEFVKYANWDENNVTINSNLFATIPDYAPYGKSSEELAKELAGFERTEIIKMLEDSIEEITNVISGEIVRRPVVDIDWENATVKDGNIYSNGHPVFLYDYFSKPQDQDAGNETLYNDYLGNMNNPKSLSIKSSVTSDGLPESSTVNKPYIFNRNVGYQMLWHNNLGTLPTNIDGNGITTFTQYDITDPDVRESWEKVLSAYVPAQADKNYTNLGYCLANEPHWFLQQGHWATAKKFDGSQGLGTDSLALFTEYAENKYSTIDAANEAWGTSFTSFEDATSKVIPISTSYRNSVLWYDVCNWNMQRASNWLTFLNDQVISNDASALTHLKVMPDLWVESNRTHGIDLEAMTDMTGMIGNDAKIRGKNFKAGSDESWSDSYAYYWKEMMSYDFMSSVSPNKSNINTESHFLSTTQFRDLYMTPEYVNSTYWLATLLGMDANLTWFWGREPDGSVESRLIGDSGMNALGEAYAASVAQQPRVANQVYQTMTDINTFASEVTEIQEQKKPIRIFYSETSAIINEDYMENQYDMYQNLFFNGFPIGFATQNIIDKQDNKLWDVIVVYNTPNVTDTEFNALQTYLNKGGTVILDSISLKYDENHKNRSAVLKEGKGKLISVDKTVDEIASQAIGCVDMSNFSPIKLSESNGLEQKGCMWRVIPYQANNSPDTSIVGGALIITKRKKQGIQ